MNWSGPTSVWHIPVEDASRVHRSAAAATAAAATAGLDQQRSAACTLVATELATNLVRYAVDGHLLISGESGPRPAVQLVAVDGGPGISDLAASLTDGWTTARSLGGGLGACLRAADLFDIHSSPRGTAVLARLGPGAATSPADAHHGCVGGVVTAHPGEQLSGDGWLAAHHRDSLVLLVVDGLGHGTEAASACREALGTYNRRPTTEPHAYFSDAAAALRGTRGGAAVMIHLDPTTGRLTHAGLGNVSARLHTPTGEHRHLVSHPGILGMGPLPRVRTEALSWPSGSVLVVHSDGLHSRWDLADHPGLELRHPALIAAVLWLRARRGHDDAAVCVVTRPAPTGTA